MEHVAGRLAAIRRQQLEALQLKLFPDWPDDRRGAPNTVIRSAVFGVVRRGRRKRVTDLPVAGPAGYGITLTGWRLDQHDCDLWPEVIHLARKGKPGEYVRFTMHSMFRRLGRTGKLAHGDYAWLEQRFKLAERILHERQVFALLDAVEDHPRDHALIRLLYNGGLRVSETVALEWRNLIDGVANIRGKGRTDARRAALAGNLGRVASDPARRRPG